MDGLRATRRIKAARSAKVIKLPRPWLLLALALSVASPASAQAPGTWAPIADLNQPRAEHTATLLADGTVLIAGGRRGASPRRAAQLFDPVTDTFTALGPMSTPRGRHTATLLRDGRVVVIGGTDGVGPLASLELYDPTRRTFSRAPSALTVARQDHTATLLPDGRVLVSGGSNASGALDSAELYDPTAGTVSSAGRSTSRARWRAPRSCWTALYWWPVARRQRARTSTRRKSTTPPRRPSRGSPRRWGRPGAVISGCSSSTTARC